MNEPQQQQKDAWDMLNEAVTAYIQERLEWTRQSQDRARVSRDQTQPVISALMGINQAVDNAVCRLIEDGRLGNSRYTSSWLAGSAWEWLKAVRDWEARYAWPEVHRAAAEADRAISAEVKS